MAGITLDRFDHVVLTVQDVEASSRFYETVLGMERKTFEGNRVSLHFGQQKINLHPYPSPIANVAREARPGTADLCFIAQTPLADVIAHLQACKIEIIQGPQERVGALGTINSVYCRDPDGNLIEVSNYLS
jgi:catechol 2,3-dioxygenase-like lactoylglutathione lyase family enzyme